MNMTNDILASPVTLEEYATLDMEEKRKLWVEISDISDEQLGEHMAEEKQREELVPQPGSEAPDFVADVLGRDRQRTGEQVRLSDLRGKPAGIIFGSYT